MRSNQVADSPRISEGISENTAIKMPSDSPMPSRLTTLGTPEDFACQAGLLATDPASYLTGATFVVDGSLMQDYLKQ
jgi:NAD(P)-dependent dehydrogenase (short-subunit alcohol dehydrogenase family)